MKALLRLLPLALLGLAVVSNAQSAETKAVQTMARILLNLNHYPSDADKAKLQTIADDTKASESVKTLAGIILSLNHTPSASDKEKLKKLTM